MRARLLAPLCVLGLVLGAGVARAQGSDDPYGAPPAAKPPAAKPPVAAAPAPPPPAAKPAAAKPPVAAPHAAAEAPRPAAPGVEHGGAPLPPSWREPTAVHPDTCGDSSNCTGMPPVEPGHGAPEHGHGAALPGHGHGPHAGHPEHPGHPGHPGHEGRAGHAPGAAEHGERASGAKHGRDENAPPGEINWFYGFLGTSKDKEPSLLWRKPEMAPPFAANLVNFALFAYILVRLGKKPLQEALAKRKETILRDMEAAQKMKQDAEKRLGVYEDKLRHIQDEVERIRKDFREQGERDRERILREAQEKRDRMLRDARFMIEQESKQLRLELMRETVDAATAAAETILRDKVSAADQARLAEAYLGELAASRGLAPTKGGSA